MNKTSQDNPAPINKKFVEFSGIFGSKTATAANSPDKLHKIIAEAFLVSPDLINR